MKPLLFSIITPSFNQGKYLSQTLGSVSSQVGNFQVEHIIADGGSTDESLEIIKKYAISVRSSRTNNMKNTRLKWWSKKDRGQSDALLKGFSIAKGDIFCWLNSDDMYASPMILEKVSQIFLKYPQVDIVFGNARSIDGAGRRLKDHSLTSKISEGEVAFDKIKAITKMPFISQPATFYRARVFTTCKIEKKLHYTMDWDLLLQAYFKRLNFYKVDRTLAVERIHPLAKTSFNTLKLYDEWVNIYSKYRLWHLTRFIITKKYWTLKIKNIL